MRVVCKFYPIYLHILRRQHYGRMDLDSLQVMGPERAIFVEFADIKGPDGAPRCMSIDGLRAALAKLNVEKHGDDLDLAFKVAGAVCV
jgi:hypothetical protein